MIHMIRRDFDIILVATGFILAVTNVGYLILKVKPENVRSIIQLTPGILGLVMGMIGMVLMEVKKGKKTVKEAVAIVTTQMLLLGLFILIVTLIRK